LQLVGCSNISRAKGAVLWFVGCPHNPKYVIYCHWIVVGFILNFNLNCTSWVVTAWKLNLSYTTTTDTVFYVFHQRPVTSSNTKWETYQIRGSNLIHSSTICSTFCPLVTLGFRFQLLPRDQQHEEIKVHRTQWGQQWSVNINLMHVSTSSIVQMM
jgi:hypothetical protein